MGFHGGTPIPVDIFRARMAVLYEAVVQRLRSPPKTGTVPIFDHFCSFLYNV
jgi:hypothetical protein